MVISDLTAQEQVKRKRSNRDDREGSDDHEGRKRGRPRVEPQTESAADVGQSKFHCDGSNY